MPNLTVAQTLFLCRHIKHLIKHHIILRQININLEELMESSNTEMTKMSSMPNRKCIHVERLNNASCQLPIHFYNLSSCRTQYRCITTEEEFFGEYQTDQGLLVPAISYKLRERFMAAAEAKGISRDRLIELVARTGTELAIQLLGGSRRLNPSNSHQVPVCVVLCGPGRTGEYGT